MEKLGIFGAKLEIKGKRLEFCNAYKSVKDYMLLVNRHIDKSQNPAFITTIKK